MSRNHVGEAHALACKTIQKWRACMRVSRAAHSLRLHLITHENENMWVFPCHFAVHSCLAHFRNGPAQAYSGASQETGLVPVEHRRTLPIDYPQPSGHRHHLCR